MVCIRAFFVRNYSTTVRILEQNALLTWGIEYGTGSIDVVEKTAGGISGEKLA